MKTHTLLFIFLLGLSGINAQQKKGQDTIFLMNGQIAAHKVLDSTVAGVSIQNPDNTDKKIYYEWNQIYMVKYASGLKRFYYEQDTTINNWFTREEMWYYMLGERDARKGFKPKGSVIGAGLFGLTGGLTGLFWAPLLPYSYMALSGIPKVKIKHSTISQPNAVDFDSYLLGYERVAKQKRKLYSLASGTAGLVLGFGLYFIFKNTYPESINLGK
jgi:hypothetical protein